MKKSYIILAVIGAAIGGLLLIIFLIYYNAYSGAVSRQETVNEKWNNVQSAYQRRVDLIPNLVNTVKGAAKNEKDILLQVTQARSGIVNAKTPEDLEIMGKKINTAINIMYEAYPEIKSTENFRDLQTQLEGTENRIKTARDEYNQATKEYNTHIRGFFNSMFINHETFPRKTGFTADKGSENAVDVDFDDAK